LPKKKEKKKRSKVTMDSSIGARDPDQSPAPPFGFESEQAYLNSAFEADNPLIIAENTAESAESGAANETQPVPPPSETVRKTGEPCPYRNPRCTGQHVRRIGLHRLSDGQPVARRILARPDNAPATPVAEPGPSTAAASSSPVDNGDVQRNLRAWVSSTPYNRTFLDQIQPHAVPAFVEPVQDENGLTRSVLTHHAVQTVN
jgi:hypothetical protein